MKIIISYNTYTRNILGNKTLLSYNNIINVVTIYIYIWYIYIRTHFFVINIFIKFFNFNIFFKIIFKQKARNSLPWNQYSFMVSLGIRLRAPLSGRIGLNAAAYTWSCDHTPFDYVRWGNGGERNFRVIFREINHFF